ncbi:unnamed protein product [Rodentolepis nana]|uniref:Ubinuclein-1 n=1 Tax=Rodentolepis nana TaxID=102285 RepID=A0A0R3T046_RODNA|nr:unnamed protein product [Rodentolepis nana]
MMLDNLRSDYNNKPKLCAIPNGYPLSPHSGAPSSIDFPTTLSLTITRQDHAYHLKSSNFSASLVGMPFFPGFEDDPFLHGPRTRSPSPDFEMIDLTDEEIAAIINEAIQGNKAEKKTSKQKKKDKTLPNLDQSEAKKEQNDEKPSIVRDSESKEKEVKVNSKKEEDKRKKDSGKEVKEEKKRLFDDSYSEAANLYPELYDGTVPDEQVDSFTDYQEVSKKKRRNKKVSNSSSVIIPNDRQSKKLSENPPNQRPSKKSAESLSQQKAVKNSDMQVVVNKSTSSIKPTPVSRAGPPDSVKPSQSFSRSTAVPTAGVQKSAWSKPLVHPPAPSTQAKSKSVPCQGYTYATPVQLIPSGNGSSNPTTAQPSADSLKKSSGTTGPSHQSQMSETPNLKGQHHGSMGFEPLEIYPSKQRKLSQVHPAPRQQSTTSKPVHKTPENSEPALIKSSKPSGQVQQSLSSKPVSQAPTLPKTSTQQAHVSSSKSSGTEAQKSLSLGQPQPSTSKTVQQTPSPSKMPQHQKPTVSKTSKAQDSAQVQPSSNVHKTSDSSQTPSQITPSVSQAPNASIQVKQEPTTDQASGSPKIAQQQRQTPSEDIDPSVESCSLPQECVPHGRIGDHKLKMMSVPQDMSSSGELSEHLRALDQFLMEEWKAFVRTMARSKRREESKMAVRNA